MRSVIVIMDSDVNYAGRLCRYMNSRKYLDLKTMVCPTKEEYFELCREYNIRVLLIDEEHFKNLPHEFRPENIFVLLKDRIGFMESDTRTGTIFKYTNAQTFVKKVMDGLDLSMTVMDAADKDAEIIGVFSPISRSGKTVFANALGLESAKKYKTLLITFDEYRGILKNSESKDLSDIMYYYKQGKSTWDYLGKAVYSANELDYIAPVRYPEDLKEMTASEIKDMLLAISESGQYSRIVIDFGSFGKHFCEVLGICSKVYMPVIYDCISRMKLEEFEAYLDYVGRENLKEKIIKINVPFYKLKRQHHLYSLETTEVARLARKCMGAEYASE